MVAVSLAYSAVHGCAREPPPRLAAGVWPVLVVYAWRRFAVT